jgi:triacylglycerol lipase
MSIKTLSLSLFSLAVFTAATFSPVSMAQDVENTRYSPQGRAMASLVARAHGDRMYEVRTYDPEPDVDGFSNATIFYPLTLSFTPPFGAVAFVPGFRANQEIYNWWGPMLASLGIAVMIIDTNAPDDSLAARNAALVEAISFLKTENGNSESPIEGRIDTSKLAIMGHSMGGGGALHAAAALGDEIKAVIPFSPYCCELGQSFEGDFSGLTVPTLIFASAEDNIAPPDAHAKALYDSISSSTHKTYAEFSTGDHNIVTNGGPDLGTLGELTYGWLKMHFDMDTRFSDMFSDNLDADMAAKFSRYETSP